MTEALTEGGVVMPGLDPGIHQIRETFSSDDGLPGQARQ
jgi:hypothetical protein